MGDRAYELEIWRTNPTEAKRRGYAPLTKRERSDIKVSETGPTAEIDDATALTEAVDRVEKAGERVLLTRDGRPLAVVVSLDDARLLQEMEDWAELEEFRAARRAAEKDERLSLDEIFREFGLTR